ncbi:MAG: glycosyltransferase family 39 protein [Thermoanaerobaculia bacterium]|nr:glycosyltransferase family 39 protein [Thermoanaerobaculia bacterium]
MGRLQLAHRRHLALHGTLDAMTRRFLWTSGLALLACLALQVQAIRHQSLIGDAPYHLLAGHQALRYGENTLNLEHPPLVKLVAAIPLLLEEPLAPRTDVRDVLTTARLLFDDPALVRRVQLRSRTLLFIVFGVPLLIACIGLGRRLGDTRSGVLLALCVGLSFSSLPFLSVIQTDTAVALGFTATLWMALRFQDHATLGRSIALGAAAGLAIAAKFSGLLVVPAVGIALLLAPRLSWRERLTRGLLIATVALAIPWSTYAIANHHYSIDSGRQAIHLYCNGEALVTGDRLQGWEETLLTLEQSSPSLAQYATGFLGIRAQNELGIYPSYAFGTLSSEGRWWYFPAVLALRTPLVLLIATFLAYVSARFYRPQSTTRRPLAAGTWVVLGALAVYFGVAVSSSYNLGVRHLLPILPLLYWPAARWGSKTFRRTLVILSLLILEGVTLAPLWMSATGSWWLGQNDPTRLLIVSGDTEYHQNFIALEDWARSQGIERYGLLYPLLDPRELAAYSARGYLVTPDTPIDEGVYVTTVLLESHLPALRRTSPARLRGFNALSELAEAWDPSWRAVLRGQDLGYVAGTFHAYRVEESPSRP